MSSGLEHQRCTEALGAYVLGALPPQEGARVELHIAICRECQAEVERLQVAADALPASVPQINPPPSLKARVMGIVEAEAELLRAAGQRADRPARTRRIAWTRIPSRWWPALVMATVCAVAGAVVLLATKGGGQPQKIQVAVTGREPRGATASLILHGSRAELVVSHLRAPGADHVDEIWIRHGARPPQRAGTFIVTSGTVEVRTPVRSGDVVLVTVEPGQGTARPTTPALLVARV